MSTASASTPRTFKVGQKPIAPPPDLPRLYIYDHCPFCVRARMIFGLKGIQHSLVFLANDDVATPKNMVDAKVVPILELGLPGTDAHEVMKESMDIVQRVDEDEEVFGKSILKGASGRTDIDEWMSGMSDVMRRLIRPRHVASPLPEFQFAASREAFIRNHPLAPPSSYDENMAMTPQLKEQFEEALQKLEPLIHCPECVTDGGVSYDDIAFFARMRSISIIKDLKVPPKLQEYLQTFSKKCDIPLYDKLAM